MSAGSVIPEIEINTLGGKITLEKATIVNIASPTTVGRKQGGGWGVEHQAFPVPKHTANRFEEMVFNFTFATIAIDHKKNKGFTDNWSSGG